MSRSAGKSHGEVVAQSSLVRHSTLRVAYSNIEKRLHLFCRPVRPYQTSTLLSALCSLLSGCSAGLLTYDYCCQLPSSTNVHRPSTIMGVQGLSRLLSSLGLTTTVESTTTSSSSSNQQATAAVLPSHSTLAIDGDGLLFHLLRLSYHQHYADAVASPPTPPQRDARQSLVLPTFLPLSLIHETTVDFLQSLLRHGMKLRIYYDGKDQPMKGHTSKLRRRDRVEEWDNLRQFCTRGVLPEGCVALPVQGQKHTAAGRRKKKKAKSTFRSSAKEQARSHASNIDGSGSNGNSTDGVAEKYLHSFPFSRLALPQVRQSIESFAGLHPSDVIQIIPCDGEADSEVAKASASDVTGRTYALGNDSDYLIYGTIQSEDDCGEAKYVPFYNLDLTAITTSDYGIPLRGGNVLSRADVAAALGLPHPSAMVEVSILMGNDYTGPFLRSDDGVMRNHYRKSLRWEQPETGEVEEFPPYKEMNLGDGQVVAGHVAERVVEGWKLTSVAPELEVAINFSYRLYSFGDVRAFPPIAPGLEENHETENDLEEEEDGTIMPRLPLGMVRNIELAAERSGIMTVSEAALAPISMALSSFASEDDDIHIDERHEDAFRQTLDAMSTGFQQAIDDPARRRVQFSDVRVLYVLEKSLLAAVRARTDDRCMFNEMFDYSVFFSCLEAFSFDDFPLDNELVAKGERAYLEEATAAASAVAGDSEPPEPSKLPIDEHKEEILRAIQEQRVTIIHGETGCGKSSRVPVLLLEADPPEPTGTAPEVKMMVSQPRRIAAKSLVERVRSCEPHLKNKIGLRMGHGLREYETNETRAWFVTTGYVVRLLANHPSFFDSHSHLIIDEVHERSVDTDILCLLCRRLLSTHPTIRLVLMSATMAAELYVQYFGSPEAPIQPPIHVGARRFQITDYFVEDLPKLLSLRAADAKRARDVLNECERKRCSSPPGKSHMENLYHLATAIASSVGSNGSAVLIFVPGMNDIEAITELIEKTYVPDVVFTCLPIHSDVPFEEQMAAFDPPGEGEVKVVIATNAAESSVTLPDVDHVICLGLCKQIVYNQASHRQMLQPCWISRASATQRAGRTGRVRPGAVYRLYSRNVFNNHMPAYECGEMVRIPLDSVILQLRDMLGEAVTPILLDCLEPPDVSTIQRSFNSLHESNFITYPTDEGEVTSLGSLVVSLGIDLVLGAFVGLGIQFGVAAEAIQLAAVLSFPKSPWAMTSPMYHEPALYNDIMAKTFISRNKFDAGSYSEPIAIMNLLYDFNHCKKKDTMCWKNGIAATRLRHLAGTIESLRRRVADCLGISDKALEVKDPPYLMPHAKLNILRILQVWLLHDTMIAQTSKRKLNSSNGSVAIELNGPPIGPDHLAQVLDLERHPYKIENRGKIIHQGTFLADDAYLADKVEFYRGFDIRFASYFLELDINLAFYYNGSSLHIFILADLWEKAGSRLFSSLSGCISFEIVQLSYIQLSGNNRRGRRGRACGAWYPHGVSPPSDTPSKRVLILSSRPKKAKAQVFKKMVDKDFLNKIDGIESTLSCYVAEAFTKKKKNMTFVVTSAGSCSEVSNIDLMDLFAAPGGLNVSTSKILLPQIMTFSSTEANNNENKGSSYDRPLLRDSPEGARLLSVLASDRRKDHFIRFVDAAGEGNDGEDNGESDDDDFEEIAEQYIDVNLPRNLSIQGSRWERRSGGSHVYVPVNSVPAATMPIDDSLELYACCANTLDLRGGACRVDGITMLPPGRLFVGLALLSFGIQPKTSLPVQINSYFSEEEKKETDIDYGAAVQEALQWICENEKSPSAQQEALSRIEKALELHLGCMDLGEQLACSPDKIRALCELFDGSDGYEMTVWDGYDKDLAVSLGGDESTQQKEKRSKGTRRGKDSVDRLQTASVDDGEKKVYACKGCGNSFPEWGKARAHLKKCCPEQRGTQWEPRCDIKCEDYIEKKPKFACLGCGKKYAKFGKCIDHMQSCCPEKMDDAGDIMPSDLKEKPAYKCKKCKRNCGKKWNKFLSHLKKCCPEDFFFVLDAEDVVFFAEGGTNEGAGQAAQQDAAAAAANDSNDVDNSGGGTQWNNELSDLFEEMDL